jgi:arginase
LAVKIVRQRKNIALLGAPTSAAALTAGHERAPAALRAAGLVARLTAAGFAVTDYGDSSTRVFQADDEHPRARNVPQVLAALEELRPKIEIAVKSGALPVVLGGDSSIVLAAIAGARRYFRNVSLIYFDRDASLKVPAATPSGSVDDMVISHVTGRGAPELVRFWGEPPLVREHEVALFGYERLDEAEEKLLQRSNLRRYDAATVDRAGGSAAAGQALESVHGNAHEFVLHWGLDVIAGEDFHSTNLSAPGGLRLDVIRQALTFLARQQTLAALAVAGYNPDLDPDGSAAKQVIELLVEVLSPRLEPEEVPEAAPAAAPTPAPEPAEPLPSVSAAEEKAGAEPSDESAVPSAPSDNPAAD